MRSTSRRNRFLHVKLLKQCFRLSISKRILHNANPIASNINHEKQSDSIDGERSCINFWGFSHIAAASVGAIKMRLFICRVKLAWWSRIWLHKTRLASCSIHFSNSICHFINRYAVREKTAIAVRVVNNATLPAWNRRFYAFQLNPIKTPR